MWYSVSLVLLTVLAVMNSVRSISIYCQYPGHHRLATGRKLMVLRAPINDASISKVVHESFLTASHQPMFMT